MPGDTKATVSHVDRAKVAMRRFAVSWSVSGRMGKARTNSMYAAVEALHQKLMAEGIGAYGSIACYHEYRTRSGVRQNNLKPVAEAQRTKFTVYWQPCETRLGTEAASVIHEFTQKLARQQAVRDRREAKRVRALERGRRDDGIA